MMRLPVFTWMTLVVSFLLILALPAIAIALAELMFDRSYGTNFFRFPEGGKPHLWQHLFWIFGHLEVYILILPAMGIVSEVIPVFSASPFWLWSSCFLWCPHWFHGFCGLESSHVYHRYGCGCHISFLYLTMLIAIPTGVKIFNWIGTMWVEKSVLTPQCFSLLDLLRCL